MSENENGARAKKAVRPRRIKKASNFFFWLLRVVLRPVLWLKYRFRFEHRTAKGIKRPCLILSNHQTSFDQFAVGVGFRFGINFVAGDSIFRHGFKSWLMQVLTNPIPYAKGSSDASAIKNIFSIIRKGGAVGIFPSGNRSFFGEECTLRPTGKLAKKLGVPLVLVQMRGGYNTKPRWKQKPNKGKMRASVQRVISREELQALSAEELDKIIHDTLYLDEFAWNKQQQIVFKGKRKAEFLEGVLFYCPQCGTLNRLHSHRNQLTCTCGMCVAVNETGEFTKIRNADNCPDTVLAWGQMQLEHIKALDYAPYAQQPLFHDIGARLNKVERSKKDEPLGEGAISLYADKLTVCEKEFPLAKIHDMSIQSMARLTLYTDEGEFTVDLPKRGNAFKYMVCGYRIKNLSGDTNTETYGY
ncbi:MAG: 1-acyl-sn-glycerol-3-phosphate acyltransferase [Firmicutes bacterium]|nr:1-acyl-sn-glycerol-3-phosphate acyltransferase [Bacillota bacterium]